MGCGCGGKAGSNVWVYTAPMGGTTTYNTEIEAKAAEIRNGGGFITMKPR